MFNTLAAIPLGMWSPRPRPNPPPPTHPPPPCLGFPSSRNPTKLDIKIGN